MICQSRSRVRFLVGAFFNFVNIIGCPSPTSNPFFRQLAFSAYTTCRKRRLPSALTQTHPPLFRRFASFACMTCRKRHLPSISLTHTQPPFSHRSASSAYMACRKRHLPSVLTQTLPPFFPPVRFFCLHGIPKTPSAIRFTLPGRSRR